ncbi:MAG: L-lactate permease [Anaerolineae bacterium]
MLVRSLLASTPLLLVLALMLWRHWSGARAGLAGLIAAMGVSWLAFGMTGTVLWVSQVRGLMLALYVLYIIWPALLVYQVVRAVGGIALVQDWLSGSVANRAAAGLILAWTLSSLLEGIAGFGVPLAVVSPSLVVLGFDPITAVAAVAVGHAWSVTFGDMGVVFAALTSVVQLEGDVVAPAAAASLAVACVGSGLAVARLLGERRWLRVVAIGAVMAAVQAGLAVTPLRPLAALGAGTSGMLAGVWLFGDRRGAPRVPARAWLRVLPYAATAAVLAAIAFVPGLSAALASPATKIALPEVATRDGWVTAAGAAKVIDWLRHPGTVMLLSLLLFYPVYRRLPHAPGAIAAAVGNVVRTATPVTLGVLAMVGLAMVMDHSGMTQSLAESASAAVGRAYPLLSGYVGMLGAFTTGSNTNANVLFGPLQMEMARLLRLSAPWLLAAQTTGGALGSMIAPAKLCVGCAAVGIAGQDGLVFRRTLPYAALLGLAAGIMALALA